MHIHTHICIYIDIFINLTGGAAPPQTPLHFLGRRASPSPQTPPPEFHEGQAPQTPHTDNVGLA